MTAQRKVLITAAAMLTTIATVGALAGCGSSSSQSSSGTPTITILVAKNSNQAKMSTMPWAKQLAKDAKVNIKWQEVSDDAWNQQKNPSLAGGSVADISLRAYGPGDADQFPGTFLDLNKYMNKLPNVKAFFKQQPDAMKLTRAPKGEIYILPSSRGKAYRGSGQNMMINKVWLKKLGLKVPTTWDEFTKVLTAFKNDDPNGNGKHDEIPMNIRKLNTSGFGWYDPFLLMNSTGIATGFNKGPSAQGIYVQNGKVKNFLISPKLRQVVNYYYELGQKGLIPKDWSTKADDAYYADQSNDGKTAKVGVIFGWSLADFGNLRNQYEAMPVPSAPGVSASKTVWDGSSNEFENNKLAVSAHTKNLNAVLRVVNLLYSEKYSVQQFVGSFGSLVTPKGNHTYQVDAAKTDKLTKANQFPGLSDRLAGWIPNDVTIKGDTNASDIEEVNRVFDKQEKNYNHTTDFMPDYVRMDASDSTAASNISTPMMNFCMQKLGKWMTKGGADADWNTYVSQMKKLGIDKFTSLWQKWYDTYVK